MSKHSVISKRKVNSRTSLGGCLVIGLGSRAVGCGQRAASGQQCSALRRHWSDLGRHWVGLESTVVGFGSAGVGSGSTVDETGQSDGILRCGKLAELAFGHHISVALAGDGPLASLWAILG